jgi:hypothetical protein
MRALANSGLERPLTRWCGTPGWGITPANRLAFDAGRDAERSVGLRRASCPSSAGLGKERPRIRPTGRSEVLPTRSVVAIVRTKPLHGQRTSRQRRGESYGRHEDGPAEASELAEADTPLQQLPRSGA